MAQKRPKKDDRIEVEIAEIADGLIFRPRGEIDMTRAPALRAELMDVQLRHPARLVVDLSHVSEIDSAVIATLVEALRVACSESGMLVLCGLQERVRSLFEIVRLDASVFTIVETVDEAIALPNRRKFGRYNPGSLQCDRGKVLDISAGGARLLTPKKLKSTIRLRFWNEQTDLAVEARVIRCKRRRFREYEAGLQFVNLSAEAANKLAGILAAVRQTLTRRVAPADGAAATPYPAKIPSAWPRAARS